MMIRLYKKQQQWVWGKFSWVSYGLICLALLGMLWGCGKLSDDTGQPSTPVGTSGGTAINTGPKSTVGTYTLSLSASPGTIPADLTNFSTLTASLTDTSGRSLAGYTVSYTTASNFGEFEGGSAAGNGVTNSNGTSTIRFYGRQSGTETIVANIAALDITTTAKVNLTSAGPASCAGTYCLTIGANPTTVPADMATYSIVYATVSDSSGGSVDGLVVEFESELGYVHNDPTPPSSPSTTATAVTNRNGSVSLYYYGDRAGSAVITARVTVPDLPEQLVTTTGIHVTEGPGVPGDGIAGLMVEVTPQYQELNGDSKTGNADPETVTFEVDVWDATGDLVGPGVRVEFSGDVSGYAETNAGGTAVLEYTPPTLYIGQHTYDVTACTYGILPDQTQYCEDFSFGITVLPPDLEVEIKAVPSSVEYNQSGTVLVTVKFLNSPIEGASVSCYSGGLISLSAGPVNTNGAGIAEFTFTGKTRAGSDTITAVVQVTIDDYFLTGDAEASVTVTEPTTTP